MTPPPKKNGADLQQSEMHRESVVVRREQGVRRIRDEMESDKGENHNYKDRAWEADMEKEIVNAAAVWTRESG